MKHIDLLSNLVRTESVSGNFRGQRSVQDQVADYLCSKDITVQQGSDSRPWTLFSTGNEKQTTLFVCHTDTVPFETQLGWTTDPLSGEIDKINGRINGRGSVDMKGGLVAATEAILHASRKGLDASLLLTGDEEIGSLGAQDAAAHLGDIEPELVVVPEATQNLVSYGHRGALWIKARAHGISAHGSRPDLGVNAIEKLASNALEIIRSFPARKDDYLGLETVNLGTLTGGSATNIVPDSASATFDFRTIADSDELVNWLEKAFPELEMSSILDLEPVQTRTVPVKLERFSSAEATTFFTDAARLTSVFPCTPFVIWGPGSPTQMHAPNESLELSSLEDAISNFIRILD
ncbi:M20 family metallopeptidase [Corynebacterium flavescens]|uniref:M20 family metallopeptidase n=1 Tax=Corynebacterium flavescens TaxID=28028 RepID=UPI003FD3F7CC